MYKPNNWVYEYRVGCYGPEDPKQWYVEYRYTTRWFWGMFRSYKGKWYTDHPFAKDYFLKEEEALTWAKHCKARREENARKENEEYFAKKAFLKANPPRIIK